MSSYAYLPILPAFFLDFVAGGFTDGVADDSVLIGMSNAHLYVRNSATKGAMVARPLPVAFAMPVTLNYNATDGELRLIFLPRHFV